MGNAGLIRRDAEMTHLQSSLGETRTPSLIQFTVGEGRKKTSSLKRGTPQNSLRASSPLKTSPFVVPTVPKEAPTGNSPMGEVPPQEAIT